MHSSTLNILSWGKNGNNFANSNNCCLDTHPVDLIGEVFAMYINTFWVHDRM